MNMSQEFNLCLEHGKIKKFTPGPRLAGKELKSARQDLDASSKSYGDKDFKWCIIQSYYSMFHSARALLYSAGYREKSHFCLMEAVKVLFVENGKLDLFLLESLAEAKNLREAADYYGDFSELNSRKLLKRAEAFLKAVEKIINSPAPA